MKKGFGTVISSRAYYNLGTRLVKDITLADTLGALLAVFEQMGWRYCLDKEISKDSKGNEI